MTPFELKVLKYISKHESISKEDILSHFRRYDNVSMEATIFNLNVKYACVRENHDWYQITDRGQLECINDILTRQECWKQRTIGFITGVLSAVVIKLITVALFI